MLPQKALEARGEHLEELWCHSKGFFKSVRRLCRTRLEECDYTSHGLLSLYRAFPRQPIEWVRMPCDYLPPLLLVSLSRELLASVRVEFTPGGSELLVFNHQASCDHPKGFPNIGSGRNPGFGNHRYKVIVGTRPLPYIQHSVDIKYIIQYIPSSSKYAKDVACYDLNLL